MTMMTRLVSCMQTSMLENVRLEHVHLILENIETKRRNVFACLALTSVMSIFSCTERKEYETGVPI
jgi:hypothetical protein